jgi:hypothetical protein
MTVEARIISLHFDARRMLRASQYTSTIRSPFPFATLS